MSRFFTRSILPAGLILFLGVMVGMNVDGQSGSDDTIEQLRKLEDAYLLINRQYVEDVSASDMTETSIRAMLERLDPHSSYIDAERMESLQEGYQGSFGGIGIWFEAPADDTARVSSIISDGPSEAVGLMPGDRIYEVDDSTVVGMNSLEIQD
ncbi:MAG: PDZ domain-containing protein, partial [Rhodothermales bacterium]|nr:PDZ domain-containing protein [Rhodothermales bacterium]